MSRRIAVPLLALLLVAPLEAATRITYDIQGEPTPIGWSSDAFPLRYEIEGKLAQTFPGAAALVDRAFAEWESVDNANVRFESDGVVEGADATARDRVVVSLTDDLFAGQGAVALTTYSFDTQTGKMLDADIRIDPSLFSGGLNAQLAITHEVGHVLGLDHSAVISSVMYPWVGPPDPASGFDSDDTIAIATIYPRVDPTLTGATLNGRVSGDQGAIFAAQVVAVNEKGHPVGTVLTNATGEFTISGIPAGRYRLYAEPLDGPVEPISLQGSWRSARGAFPTRFFGPPIDVENGRVYGNLILNTAGAVRLNPRWIGLTPENSQEVSLSSHSITMSPGETATLVVAGDGFTGGMTEFEVLNPAFRRVSDFNWADNYVSARFTVDPGATSSSAVIIVRDGNETAALTGALRIGKVTRARSVRK